MDNLINRAACKKFTLKWAQEHRRGCDYRRVSKQYLDDLDSKVRLLIQDSVNKHRSVGKTITDLF